MSEIIDVTPNGETIAYDANGNAMVQANGQWVYAPQYNRPPVQSVPTPAPPVYQQPQAPAPVQASSGNTMLAFFQGGTGTTDLPSYMLAADTSSMDGQDQTMVDMIRLDNRGDLVPIISGVTLPSQRSLEVVILGCGPTGGRSAVYRTLFPGNYNADAEAEAKKPICWSYDNVAPAPNVPARQSNDCNSCPMNIKGSGPNNTRKCGKSQFLMVALASDLSQVFRIKVSSKGIYSADVSKNEYGLKPYATLLKSKNANWEGVVTRLECPDGLVGGLRFTPVRFLTEQEYKQAQEQKMKLDIQLYVNLDADQNNVTVTMGDQTVATVPAANLGQVVQQVQQAVTQAVTQAPAPVAAPAPMPAPMPAPAPQPLSFRDQLQAHPQFAILPENIKAYLLNPQVAEQEAHNYVAQYLPYLLTPTAPTPAPAPAPSPVVAPAGVSPQPAPAPTMAHGYGAPAQPTGADYGSVAAAAPVQPAVPAAAPVAEQVAQPMPAAPAEPVAPAEPAPAPAPAPAAATNGVGVVQAQNVQDLLASI